MPFIHFKIARLALTQVVKRCPINLRPLLLVPKTPNPKGIALFLSSLVKLSRVGLVDGDTPIRSMVDKLLCLRSPGEPYSTWGYNFDWQTRSHLVPKGSPNIICSTFAANALLDAHEEFPSDLWLSTALSTADFILDKLFWREGESIACFDYTRVERTVVHNANLLGAAFLCRISRATGEKKYRAPALDAARYSVTKQHDDGSWNYGESQTHQWIDNFHTGYNLIALKHVRDYGQTTDFNESIRRGLAFYKAHFFREDGAPKYYHNDSYPIDIHSVAQSIITLVEFKECITVNANLALEVLSWGMRNMWDARGFFYFQKLPHYTIRTPFMRWSQAWMLLALSVLLTEREAGERQ
jgi:hypothetical protein